DAGEWSGVIPTTANVAIADSLTNPLMAAPFVEFAVEVQGQCQTLRPESLVFMRTSGVEMPLTIATNGPPRHRGDTSQEGLTGATARTILPAWAKRPIICRRPTCRDSSGR